MDRGQQFPEEENVCDGCGETLPAGSSHIHLSPEDVDMYKEIVNQARLQASMSEHMRTAPVNLSNIDELKQHLVSAHDMHPNEFYRDDTNADNPNMDPIDWDEVDNTGVMPDMSHRDLIALHNADHQEYEDQEHTTLDASHFHH